MATTLSDRCRLAILTGLLAGAIVCAAAANDGAVGQEAECLAEADPTWWEDGVDHVSSIDAWFRGWLGDRVDAAASTTASPLSDALRQACPSIAFSFDDEGDAFVLDFTNPSLVYTPVWAGRPRADLVLGPSAILA